jgi:hypothetical protein
MKSLSATVDALMQISAGLEQIRVRLRHLIAVEVELGLGKIQPILQRALICIPRLCQCGREPGHACLVAVEQLLQALEAVLHALRRLRKRGRVRLDLAQRRGECNLELLIGPAQRRLCERALFGRQGQTRELLSAEEQTFIDSGRAF